MRIAYVCADQGVPVFGQKGCSIHVREVIETMLQRRFQVELFASRAEGHPPASWHSVRIHRLPHITSSDPQQREQLALAANQQTMAALQNAGPFDLIYERYSLWSYAGMEYSRRNRTTGLLEVNAPLIDEQAEHRVLIDRASAESVARRAFGSADSLIAVSHQLADNLNNHPSARGRVHVIPNGVCPRRFPDHLQPSLPASPGTFTVGFVGSMKPWHGLPLLIEAFDQFRRLHSNTRLLIVGDGKVKEQLQATLAEHNLTDLVHFTGGVNPQSIPGLLASMDVAVAPYPPIPHFYFSPLKVYEYMAAGRAIVASRIGTLADLIVDGVNGLLCEAGDVNGIAQALLRLSADPPLRQRLGSAARQLVLGNYTWDHVLDRIMALASTMKRRAWLTTEAAS